MDEVGVGVIHASIERSTPRAPHVLGASVARCVATIVEVGAGGRSRGPFSTRRVFVSSRLEVGTFHALECSETEPAARGVGARATA